MCSRTAVGTIWWGQCERGRARTGADVADARGHDAAVERAEAELGAAAGERLDDARDVVADEDEARHRAVRLHRAPQRVLRVLLQGMRVFKSSWGFMRRAAVRLRRAPQRVLLATPYIPNTQHPKPLDPRIPYLKPNSTET